MKPAIIQMLRSLQKLSTISIPRLQTQYKVSALASFFRCQMLTVNCQLAFEKPPFRCENEGWGEFDMTIDLYVAEKGGKHTIAHDLNFAKPRYESKHVINFRNPNANLLALLSKSGPIPGDDVNGARKKGGADDAKKRKRTAQVDMDKLAEGLVKLTEDDLLQVVQMIHDNKSEDTYTKNDIESKSTLPYFSKT